MGTQCVDFGRLQKFQIECFIDFFYNNLRI